MIFPYLSFLTFCSCIVMGIIGFILDPLSRKNRAFSIFSFIVSIWSFADIFYFTASDKATGWFWYRITSIGWGGMIFGIFYIFMEFAGYYKRTPFIIKAAFIIYSIAMMIIQFNSTLFLKDFNQTANGLIEEIDVLSAGFFLQFGGMLASVITGVFFLVKTVLKTRLNREKRMLKIFIFLGLLSSFMGIGLNVMQAFLPGPVPPFGSVFMLVFITGILYLIWKFRFLRIDYTLFQNETFNIISDFIIMISPEKKILNVNNAVKNAIKSDVIDISDLFVDKKEFDQYLEKSVSGKIKIYKKHILLKGKKEENIPSYLSICPIFDDFKDYIGSILIARPLSGFEKIINEYKISPQEKKVILLLREGLQNKEIADKMKISNGVIKNHINSIYHKIKADNRIELLQLFFPNEA